MVEPLPSTETLPSKEKVIAVGDTMVEPLPSTETLPSKEKVIAVVAEASDTDALRQILTVSNLRQAIQAGVKELSSHQENPLLKSDKDPPLTKDKVTNHDVAASGRHHGGAPALYGDHAL